MTEPNANVDYADLYDGYWQSPDRFGEHSFQDPEALVAEILAGLGTGRILDVGCGMGLLVRTLLAQGVDAHGLDVSAVAVAHGNSLAPGRFHEGSILGLPFPDGHFDIVVSTDCMEHLHEGDVPKALAELHRVSKRGLYLRLATTPDRDGHWHLTVQKRPWWEDRLFAAGFRKHPRAMAIVPYEQLEQDGWQITLVQERLSDEALKAHPIERLLESRDLHMDMLRETGRRSDAHVARYHLAADHVRPNDVVVDVACGLGYGSAVLAANSEASRVIGVDLDEYAVNYATAMTSANWPQVSFEAADATRLAFLADRSVDLITSFETLEHVPDPEALLAEFDRVLKPSGRVIVSVPHLWVDETGKDPNPHHLHVYDWPKLEQQLAQRFLPEAVWSQTAGGGMKLTDAPRRIVRADLNDPSETPAEWWLAMAMKTPIDAKVNDYDETCFPLPEGSERPNVTAFARDYDNPWLVKAMVTRGQRAIDDGLLRQLAEQVLSSHDLSDGRADSGAALCVLAYRMLGDPAADTVQIDRCIAQIDDYCATTVSNPNSVRWQVSLHFVAGCMLRNSGRRSEAANRFRRCAKVDAGYYSPILGTKSVDALLQSGLIAVADGDYEATRGDWQQALATAERLLQGDWSTFVGDRSQPLAFGLREATDLLDLTARVARGLLDLPSLVKRPGKTWELLRFGLRSNIDILERAVADLSHWNQGLLDNVTYLQAQERLRLEEARQAESQVSRAELQQQIEQLQAEAEQLRAQLHERTVERDAAQATAANHEILIANLQRMRGIKGTIRGLVDRLKD